MTQKTELAWMNISVGIEGPDGARLEQSLRRYLLWEFQLESKPVAQQEFHTILYQSILNFLQPPILVKYQINSEFFYV